MGGSAGKPASRRFSSCVSPRGAQCVCSSSRSPALLCRPLAPPGGSRRRASGPEWAVFSLSRAVSGRRSSDSHFLSPGAGGLHPARAAAVPAGLGDPRTGLHEPPAPGPTLRPGPSGSMGGAREAGWVAAGLVLGAGACYCIYRLMRGQRRGGHRLRLRPSQSAGEDAGCSAGGRGQGDPRGGGRKRHRRSWLACALSETRSRARGGKGGPGIAGRLST